MGSIKKITILLISLFLSTMLLAGECSVKVKIVPPQNDGGTPITGYRIEAKQRSSPKWYRLVNWDLLPQVLEYTFKGGFEHDVYEFRVKAINKYGESSPSEPDRVDFAKSEYWEVFLVCEKGASRSMSLTSNTCTFDVTNLLDISPRKKHPIPYRLEE